MRSTIRWYAGGSSNFVPPTRTNSPVMPCGLPISFTRSRNAGGKLYSRPTIRPIFIAAPSRCLVAFLFGDDALTRLLHHVLRHRGEIAGVAEHAQLPVRARPIAQ